MTEQTAIAEGGTTEQENALVERLMEEVFPKMSQVFGTIKCCLPASRAVVEALRAAGVTANPLPVGLEVYPPKFVARAKAEDRMPETEDEWLEWAEDQRIHGIQFGREDIAPGANAWEGGHCVVIMLSKTGTRLLLDPSFPQIEFPEDGIPDLHPLVIAGVSPEFAGGEEPVQISLDNGCDVVYRPHPEHQSYLETVAYASPDPFSPITATIMHFKRVGGEYA